MANTNISDSQIDNLVSLLDGYVQEVMLVWNC